MRIHVIACQVFGRSLYAAAANSKHVIELTLLPQGLHDTPSLLREMVNEAVQQVESKYDRGLSKHLPDAIALGYGLCSNGVAGVTAGRIPIVMPRTDDCIGIFLGSQKRYLELFKRYNGIYWLNRGWMESAFIPTKEQLEKKYLEYRQKYGEDNARYLMEEDLRWMRNYRYLGYITSPLDTDLQYSRLAQETAQAHQWEYLTFSGEDKLLEKLLSGQWKEEKFLICPPGYRIVPSFDNGKVRAEQAREE